jgi:hypothetical protein
MAQVYVVGTDAVTSATREWADVHGRVDGDFNGSTLPFWRQVEVSFAENRRALSDGWDSLVRAMRADVSPSALLRRPE